MKRTFILVSAVMLLVGTFAFAEKSMLIDFTLLDEDLPLTDENGNESNQNKRTVMDFSVAAGATFTDDQKSLMKTSLALRNWEVKLNSSAKSVNAVALSQVLPAKVKETKKGNGDATVDVTVPFKGKSVMGVRVLFPTWN